MWHFSNHRLDPFVLCSVLLMVLSTAVQLCVWLCAVCAVCDACFEYALEYEHQAPDEQGIGSDSRVVARASTGHVATNDAIRASVAPRARPRFDVGLLPQGWKRGHAQEALADA
jgi:hypothetical protein